MIIFLYSWQFYSIFFTLGMRSRVTKVNFFQSLILLDVTTGWAEIFWKRKENWDVSLDLHKLLGSYLHCYVKLICDDIIFTLWCHKMPHSPNAKFPPITALLNRSAYHKSAKTLSPNFMGSLSQWLGWL